MAKGNRRKRGKRARDIELEQIEKRRAEREAIEKAGLNSLAGYMAGARDAHYNAIFLHTEEGMPSSVKQPDSFVHVNPNTLAQPKSNEPITLGADDEWKENPPLELPKPTNALVEKMAEAFGLPIDQAVIHGAGGGGLGLFQQQAGQWSVADPKSGKPTNRAITHHTDTGPNFPYQQGANQITAEMMKLREEINVLKSELSDADQALALKDEVIEELRNENRNLQRRLVAQPVQSKKRTAF